MRRVTRIVVIAGLTLSVLMGAASAWADGCDDDYYREMYSIAALRAAGNLDDWWEMYLIEQAQRNWNACKIANGAFTGVEPTTTGRVLPQGCAAERDYAKWQANEKMVTLALTPDEADAAKVAADAAAEVCSSDGGQAEREVLNWHNGPVLIGLLAQRGRDPNDPSKGTATPRSTYCEKLRVEAVALADSKALFNPFYSREDRDRDVQAAGEAFTACMNP